MKITTSLFLSFTVMAVLIGIAGFVSYSQVTKLQDSIDVVQNVHTPEIILVGEIKSNFNEMVGAELAYQLHHTDPHLEVAQAARAKLLESYSDYKDWLKDDPAVQKLGEEISDLFVVADQMSAQTEEELASDGHINIDRIHYQLLIFDYQKAKVDQILDNETNRHYVALQTTGATVFADIERGLQFTSILAVTGVAVVIAIGGLAAYSISQRVKQLRTVASGIAGGNLELKIKTTGSDELSALASSFEQMRGNLVSAQQELSSKNLKLQEIDKLKDEFISIASHELRTPIHPILGYALKAREGKVPMQTAIDVICTQAERLRRLANDILDVSRIESGTMSYNMQKVGIHEVLQNCLVASSSTISSKEVEINTKLDEENNDLEIVADKDRLTQVFSNILSNAAKFTKKGSINVETHVDKGTEKMEISISDTGGGIPKEILPRLFGKFATKSMPMDGTNGTGLGLFISRAIVNAHGGEILGYNNNIGGATFKVVLPVNGRKK